MKECSVSRFAIVRLFVVLCRYSCWACLSNSQELRRGESDTHQLFSGPCYGTLARCITVAIEANGATFFNGGGIPA